MSRLRLVSTEKAPKPLPQFSQAIILGDLVFCSGNIGIAPDTGKLVDGGIKDQTKRALLNISEILKEAGSDLGNLVKMNIFLTTMDNFGSMNEVFDEFVKNDIKPMARKKTVMQKKPPK